MKRGARSGRVSDANDAKTTPLIIKRSRELGLYLRRRVVPYSRSFTLVCRGDIPVNSSWIAGFRCLATESRRVSSRRSLGQNVGQRRKLFGHRRRGGADEELDRVGPARSGVGRINWTFF